MDTSLEQGLGQFLNLYLDNSLDHNGLMILKIAKLAMITTLVF